MRLLDALRDLLGLTSSPNVRLFCPDGPSLLDGDEEDPVLVGTEDAEPAFRDDGVAYYECECGEYHGFLWGPPAPVYVGDARSEQVRYHSRAGLSFDPSLYPPEDL